MRQTRISPFPIHSIFHERFGIRSNKEITRASAHDAVY
ncbi:hypothetical protein SD78_2871 [Bacillus badius]|nr:hypothetical protein SD78_2871 [Bacillus badius]